MSDTPKKRLDLCEGHKQEWKQSHYAEHNCDYCKLERELAVLEAKRRKDVRKCEGTMMEIILQITASGQRERNNASIRPTERAK